MISQCRTSRIRLDVLSKRRGTILVWFAMFLFVLIPLMALIMHLGMVTLTRRQMQTAVNGAALEGLRLKDDGPPEWNETPYIDDLVDHCGDPPKRGTPEYKEWLKCARRWSTRRQISAVFDDNLNSDSSDVLRLGAGPVIDFDDESSDISLPGTDFKASRTIKSENIGVYDPVLELNEANEPHGDMVSGQYDLTQIHSEGNSYEREDLNLVGGSDDAFLVRLRRTDKTSPLDQDTDVSSSGPTIPFLFGRSANTRAEYVRGEADPDPAALWNQRERGTIVRATAIAQAQPAYRVGVRFQNDDIELLGLLNVQMDINLWLGEEGDGETVTLVVGNDLSGQVQLISTMEERLNGVTTVGEDPFDHTGSTSLLDSTGYVVLTDGTIEDTEGDPIRRIVGFGLVTGATLTNGDTEISITRQLPQPVGSQNVTASVRPPESGDWDNLDLSSLFSKIQAHSTEGSLVLAPALVRTME